MAGMKVDILCVPGHKGLCGIQGCGLMLLGENCPPGRTLWEGGSGSASLEWEMPAELPEHFEAGTLPTPAAAALDAGIRWVQSVGVEAIHALECRLWRMLRADLASMGKIRVADETPGAVLLLNADGFPPSEIAEKLNRRGICVRAGYHCAPAAHRTLGTIETGGVRVSFGAMNTERDVRDFSDALWGILREK
jgi:selenocysteine lyase/cysteine desulfurase